ncbi:MULTISPECIES: hypothetical protein [unclassified Streptomyces]|uniref:hypothetical protein n=1 Tax=unclassified Streptomyces TaxID=2593676 RepID=UPI002E2E0777|nr:hypothetical protein [Streptomyces sp. NBC_00273]
MAYFVFKAARRVHPGTPGVGHMVVAITTGAAVFGVLYVLLGTGITAGAPREAGPVQLAPAVGNTTTPVVVSSAD